MKTYTFHKRAIAKIKLQKKQTQTKSEKSDGDVGTKKEQGQEPGLVDDNDYVTKIWLI